MCLTGITTTPSKSSSRSARATTSRVHHLTLTTPLPAQELHQHGTAERAYLWSSAKWERLLTQFDRESQASCYRGQVKSPRKCLKDRKLPVWISLQRIKRATSFLLNKPSMLQKKIQNQECRWFLVTMTYLLCCCRLLLLEWEASVNNYYAVTN